MFKRLFTRPHAIKRYLNAPLLEERLRYLSHRAEQGYALSVLQTTASYQLIIIKYLPIEEGRMITLEEITSASNLWGRYEKRRFCLKNNSCLFCKKEFVRHAVQWLSFLGHLEIPPKPPVPIQITEFVNYMRNEKGLAETTIHRACEIIQDFFGQFKEELGHALARLTPEYLDNALIQEFNKGMYARRTIQMMANRLHVFLRFTENHGWSPRGLADSIKIPRIYKHQTLPLSPSWEDVQRLVQTTQGNSFKDIRDRAILLLLAVYGLRDSEVRQLRLDDLDWEKRIIHIKHTKRGLRQQYPLTQTVGRALMRYIKNARPLCSSHNEVFLTLIAPVRPLDNVNHIVNKRWKPLNVDIKYHGPHSLRHACATRLINQGMSLKTIADQLGHRDLDTTRIYAKVDLVRLREVANINMGGLS